MKRIEHFFKRQDQPVSQPSDESAIESESSEKTKETVETRPLHSETASNEKQSSKTGRQFRVCWQENFKWIKHDVEKDSVFCEVCCQAVEMKMPLPTESREKDSYYTFVERGFTNWKKGD